MSYINATLLNDLQVMNVTDDKRFTQLGYVDLAADSTDGVDYILPSDIEKMNTMSSLRGIKIPVIKDGSIDVGIVPGFNYIPSNLLETDTYGYQAVDIFSGFSHYEATYANNQVEGKQVAMTQLKRVCYAMGQKLEEFIATTMEARKTQVLPYGLTEVSQGDGTFTFSTVTDTLTVNKAAQKESMFAGISQIMDANDLGGYYRIVTNPGGLFIQQFEQAKYGQGNQKNLEALGFFTPEQIYSSKYITTQSGEVFNGFVVRDGAIGLIENFPFDFANNTEFAGKKWSISDVELPFCRVRGNIYTETQSVDATALITSGTDSNAIMTTRQVMGIWIRVYIVYPYNSSLSTRANDIVKVIGTTT